MWRMIFLAGGLLGAAPAAAVVVASYSGTVISGFDTDGLFGAVNADLTGKAFVVDFAFDKNLAAQLTTDARAEIAYNVLGGPSPLLGLTITIGGVPKTLSHLGSTASFVTDIGSYWDAPYVSHFASFNFNDGTRDMNGAITLVGAGGAISALLDQNGEAPIPNLSGEFSYNLVTQFNFDTGLNDVVEGARIVLGGVLAANSFAEDPSSSQGTYSVTGGFTPPPVNSVPEPASWAMMIAGFGLVGAAARRRRSLQHMA